MIIICKKDVDDLRKSDFCSQILVESHKHYFYLLAIREEEKSSFPEDYYIPFTTIFEIVQAFELDPSTLKGEWEIAYKNALSGLKIIKFVSVTSKTIKLANSVLPLNLYLDKMATDTKSQVIVFKDKTELYYISTYFSAYQSFNALYTAYLNDPDLCVEVVDKGDVATPDFKAKSSVCCLEDIKVVAAVIVMLLEKPVPTYNEGPINYRKYAERRITSLYASLELNNRESILDVNFVTEIYNSFRKLPKLKRVLFNTILFDDSNITENVLTIVKFQGMTTIKIIYDFINNTRTMAHLVNDVISEVKDHFLSGSSNVKTGASTKVPEVMGIE